MLQIHNRLLPTKDVHNVFHVVHLRTSFNEWTDRLDGTFDGPRNLVDILRLDNSLQIVFENLGEIVWNNVNTTEKMNVLQRNILCNSDPLKYLRISSQSGGLSYRPKLGFSFPLRIFRAVLFPIPLVPTRPST